MDKPLRGGQGGPLSIPLRGLIAQDFQHGFVALLLGEELGDVFAVLVLVDDDVFGRGDEAVLDAAVAPETLLIGSGVEKAYIERVVLLQLGRKMALACESAL